MNADFSTGKTDRNIIIDCENLYKIYKTTGIEVVSLQGINLTVHEGEFIAIVGSSGSGKSTLMNMIGGLDSPSAGKIFVAGYDLLNISESDLVKFKREVVGFVWQNNARNMIPYLTAIQNVELPMTIAKQDEKTARAKELLEMVDLSHRENSKLGQLSGGEQQRVAIAIAMANSPRILLADEPTGSVDTLTASRIMEFFKRANEVYGVTVIIVTHDIDLAKRIDRVVSIRDGKTGSEVIRHRNDMGEEIDQIEYMIIEQNGRILLPDSILEQAGLKEMTHAKIDCIDGKIIIYKE